MGRYLVTGGAGFIGSHLCEALVRRGDMVVVLDDLSAGTVDNLSAIAGAPDVTVVHGSAGDAPLVSELVADVDAVVHLASDVGVRQTLSRPQECWDRNTAGARTLLGAASRRQLKVLLASTSEVYGPRPPVPVPESAPVLSPVLCQARWAYAASKVFAEREAVRLSNGRGLRPVVARIFNTVGERQTGRYGMVVPRLVDQAIRGEDLTVHGDGAQRRCFADVQDVVAALLALVDDDRAVGRAVNVGGREELSILELARLVQLVTGSSSAIRLVPYEQAYGAGYQDVRRRVPDLGQLGDLLDWLPQRSIASTVERVGQHAVATGSARTEP